MRLHRLDIEMSSPTSVEMGQLIDCTLCWYTKEYRQTEGQKAMWGGVMFHDHFVKADHFFSYTVLVKMMIMIDDPFRGTQK